MTAPPPATLELDRSARRRTRSEPARSPRLVALVLCTILGVCVWEIGATLCQHTCVWG